MVCTFCRQDIIEGQKKYFSKQAGMKGYYHWDCFIDACKLANKIGSQEIETIAVSAGVYTNQESAESSDD